MAIKLNELESTGKRWKAASEDYPQGEFINGTGQGKRDGSYAKAEWANDLFGFHGAILKNGGETPNGQVETANNSQVYNALKTIIKNDIDTLGGDPSAIASGTVNAITATFTKPITLEGGKFVKVRATGANTSATVTFDANGLGAKPVIKGGGLPLSEGDIAGAGYWMSLIYDAMTDSWVLQNPATVDNIPRIVDSIDDVIAGGNGMYAVKGMTGGGLPGTNISDRVAVASGSTAERRLGERFADIVNVKDFGAKGDGVTDDTAAFKNAAASAGANAVIFVPSGSYKLSESIRGMFITNGRVETSQRLDIIDLNAYKTRGYVEKLRFGMLFSYNRSGLTFYLQGFCSDGERYVWFSLITSDNANQKLVRIDTETGEEVVKDFTSLHHANGLAYHDGKVYVATLSTPAISVHDAETLAQISTFDPDGAPSGGGAVAFDGLTNKFYYYSSASVHVYSEDWSYIKSIAWTWPDWTPPVGQSMGAHNGLLFMSRSDTSGYPPNNHEAIIVFDTEKCDVVYQWMVPGSFGELESVAFFKNKLLLGFNDGSHEIPFYIANFDKTLPLESPQSTEEFSQMLRPYFGDLSQETVKIYVDATASCIGDGTTDKPFNSLKRAIWCARQPEIAYRVAIYVSGDFTKTPFNYLQGMPRLTQILPWKGKADAVIPPIRIIDSNVRIGAITVKGLDDYGGTVTAINADNSDIDIRGTKFDPASSSLTPNSYITVNRGTLYSLGMDFSLTGSKIPTRYVTCYSGASLVLLASASSFKFPAEASKSVRFYTYGQVCTQYANCRQLIVNNVYNGSKLASIFDSDGLDGTPTLNNPAETAAYSNTTTDVARED